MTFFYLIFFFPLSIIITQPVLGDNFMFVFLMVLFFLVHLSFFILNFVMIFMDSENGWLTSVIACIFSFYSYSLLFHNENGSFANIAGWIIMFITIPFLSSRLTKSL